MRVCVQTMLPCSQAEQEAKPTTATFSITVSAPMECLWARFDATDVALYPGVKVSPHCQLHAVSPDAHAALEIAVCS